MALCVDLVYALLTYGVRTEVVQFDPRARRGVPDRGAIWKGMDSSPWTRAVLCCAFRLKQGSQLAPSTAGEVPLGPM